MLFVLFLNSQISILLIKSHFPYHKTKGKKEKTIVSAS